MIPKFSLILFLLSSMTFAEVVTVIDRNSEAELVATELEKEKIGLSQDDESFQHFIILKGTSNDPQKISELSDAERLRVMTLAYHLNRARNYFVQILNADHLSEMAPLKIRYDIANSFSSGRQFTKAENEFNNAVTNKASNKYILSNEGIKPWGVEIWFRPAKDQRVTTPPGVVTKNTDISEEILNLANTAVYDITRQASLGISNPGLNADHYMFQLGLILALKKIIPTTIDLLVSQIPFTVRLDSAMIPEIIYHEFTHVALSDKIPLTGSFPTTEAIANYFAATISGRSSIADDLGDFGKNIEPIAARKTIKYKSKFEEDPNFAHHSFTLNYLWQIRSRVDKDIDFGNISGSILFDQIVFESRNYLDVSEKKTITKSLPEALAKACDKIVTDKKISRLIRLIVKQEAKKFGM